MSTYEHFDVSFCPRNDSSINKDAFYQKEGKGNLYFAIINAITN